MMHLLEQIVALLPRWSSVHLSVWEGCALWSYGLLQHGFKCLWLDSPMFLAPWQQSMSTYSQPSFSSSTWKRGGVWICKPGV